MLSVHLTFQIPITLSKFIFIERPTQLLLDEMKGSKKLFSHKTSFLTLWGELCLNSSLEYPAPREWNPVP